MDERYVESSDPQSNYGQYLALLPPHIQESLVHVPILETGKYFDDFYQPGTCVIHVDEFYQAKYYVLYKRK